MGGDKREWIPVKRRDLILSALKEAGSMSILELSDIVGASPSTIRRDLNYLHEFGFVSRSYGGATYITNQSTTFEPGQGAGMHLARREKSAIAMFAVKQVTENQSVLLDSSTTVLEVAKLLSQRRLRVTALTNDIRIASTLAESPAVQLVMVGGTRREKSFTLVGEPGLRFLDNIRADVAFIGTHSISNGALSETSLEVASMKRLMIASSKRVLVLADSSKFGSTAFCVFAKLNDEIEIVTDEGIATATRSEIEEAGTKLHVVTIEPNPRSSIDSTKETKKP